MIRGMGMYSRDEVVPDPELPHWEISEDPDPEPRLRAAKERCLARDDAFVWVGLFEPDRAELDMVADVFDLPRLLVEDASNRDQRPKFELDHNGHGLALLKSLDYIDSTSDVLTGQLAVFVGPWFAVTVRFGEIGDLRGIRARVEQSADLRSYGPVSVLYAVLDKVVDGYLAIGDEIGEDVEHLEAEVFSQDAVAGTANSIYRLKRENIEMRRAVGPLVPWAHAAVGQELPWVPPGLRSYFRDIGEHVLRAHDGVEAADNLLMTMLMASTSLQDLQQNRDMRKISAWVAIGVVPTAMAGIYGMNFDAMPELHWSFGYPLALLTMATVCVLLYRAFKRSGWL